MRNTHTSSLVVGSRDHSRFVVDLSQATLFSAGYVADAEPSVWADIFWRPEMEHARIAIVVILASFLGLVAPAASRAYTDNDILRFNLPAEPTIDPDRACKSYTSLTASQISICQRQPHATVSALQGVQVAIHECKAQFAGYRWNCSDLEGRAVQSHPLVRRGYRESAFVQAIMAAGVAHQVATACANSNIKNCGCDSSVRSSPGDSNWQWGGCSHDIAYGAKFSRRFLQEKGSDLQALIAAHNNKIGRKVLADKVTTKCKCLGMSSSCELRTCWLSTPDFGVIGDAIFELYKNAIQVDRTNTVEGRLVPASTYSPENGGTFTVQSLSRNLVYNERSPTYCEADPSINVSGTSGRLCNTTSSDVDNCHTLCCGRGYFTIKVRRAEKCNCKFHWCCYVACDKCTSNDWVTVCK